MDNIKKYEVYDNDNGNLRLINVVEGASAVDALGKCVGVDKKENIEAETSLFGVLVDFAYLPIRRGKFLMAQPA